MRTHAPIVGIAGPALFVAIVALLHALEPETNDTGAISEYALGDDYGWLMNIAFIAAGIGLAALAFSLAGALRQSRRARAGRALLLISALGWILLGAGNIDPEGADTTWHGVVHGIGFFLATPAALAAMFVLARVFRSDPGWSKFGRLTLWTAVAALLAFLLAFMDVLEPLTFRLFVAVALGWVMLASARLAGLWDFSSPEAELPRPHPGVPDRLP
jgi:hypothetical membrane protein